MVINIVIYWVRSTNSARYIAWCFIYIISNQLRLREVECNPEFSQLVSVMATFTNQVCPVSKSAPFPQSPSQLIWFTFFSILKVSFLTFRLPSSPHSVAKTSVDHLVFLPYTSSLYDMIKNNGDICVLLGKRKIATESSYFTDFKNDKLFFLPKYRRKEQVEDCSLQLHFSQLVLSPVWGRASSICYHNRDICVYSS